MRQTTIAGAALLWAAAAGLAPLPARADDRCDRAEVRAERAIAIARETGMALVEELDCDDGRWDVEGRDANGHAIEVEIDPRSARVLEVERDD